MEAQQRLPGKRCAQVVPRTMIFLDPQQPIAASYDAVAVVQFVRHTARGSVTTRLSREISTRASHAKLWLHVMAPAAFSQWAICPIRPN